MQDIQDCMLSTKIQRFRVWAKSQLGHTLTSNVPMSLQTGEISKLDFKNSGYLNSV